MQRGTTLPIPKGPTISDAERRLMEMRHFALPILESYGVDLVLTGHSHSYERSFLLKGHYGPSDTLRRSMIRDYGDGRPQGDGSYQKGRETGSEQGAVYIVAGNAGKLGGGPLDHPAMKVSLNELGSLMIDIEGLRLDAKLIGRAGEVLDRFSLIKDGSDAARPAKLREKSRCSAP